MKMGDAAGAMESHRRALAIIESLVAADPASVQIRGDLLIAHNRMGNIFVANNDYVRALESHREAMALTQQLAV